ncbi:MULTISPECIES: PAP2 family lipid A phosphatase [Psychrobacter]|uniref:Phosphoesterase n=1 Tax=Psychrobacter alimentarius TaxID=261164 RepID=A0ABM5ZWK1_9GAMM|nr:MULTISPECIES: PAP2 family lipid A phosphatase [Psychrobacter]AMT96389.1 phosphoesterase [Psychrobacter alimentarius]QCB31218.1 PAP2 family lipid A phosphatase [Psychrobacter sp. PAMC27889]
MNTNHHVTDWTWLKLLCSTIIATVALEHSQIDLLISKLFYLNGQWLLEKGAQPYALIFYDAPKALLILFATYLMIVLAIKYRTPLNADFSLNHSKRSKYILPLAVREISYLLIVIIIVPTTIATLKSVTHVSCPNHLMLFGSDMPYLDLWQSIVAKTPAKCFPAAHASAGFSLYGLAFLPTWRKYRYKIFEAVTALGWTMGLYKMLFGDHFFSHTLVSMLLSLTIACALEHIFFKRFDENKNSQFHPTKPTLADTQKR